MHHRSTLHPNTTLNPKPAKPQDPSACQVAGPELGWLSSSQLVAPGKQGLPRFRILGLGVLVLALLSMFFVFVFLALRLWVLGTSGLGLAVQFKGLGVIRL